MMMRTLVAGAVTGLLGFGGAVAGYQQFVAPTADPTVPVASADPAVAASPARERARVKFEKCPRGFKLEGRVCVQRIERTVVVDGAAPVPATTAPRQVAPVRALPAAPADDRGYAGDDGNGYDSDGYRDEYEDDHEYEDDDAYDDDHEDDDHEDEDHEDEDHEDEDHEAEDHGDDD